MLTFLSAVLLCLTACSDGNQPKSDSKESAASTSLVESSVMTTADVIPASSFKAASGVSEKSTSEVNDFQVWEVQKTRFGDASLVGPNATPADAIMFNGKKVFEDQGMYVGIYGYFQLKDSDVILLGSNPGGSATPETAMTFLVITSKNATHVLSDPEFVAVSQGDIKARRDKGDQVRVSLGFHEGNESIAELSSGILTVSSIPRNGHSMEADACQGLYEVGAEVCASEYSRKQGCGDFVANAGEMGIMGSNAAMGSFKYFSNKPGFIKAGFSKTCLAWCKGKEISYQDFGKETCGNPNAERSLPTDNCKELFEAGKRKCAAKLAREDCSQYVADTAGGLLAPSDNDQNDLTAAQSTPGFIQAGFSRACHVWCDGKTVSYKEFKKTTCSIK